MRNGGTDAELIEVMRSCLAVKKAGHGINEPTFIHPPRPMSAIGG
jgi:cyclic pyranopterin phosphate synthase